LRNYLPIIRYWLLVLIAPNPLIWRLGRVRGGRRRLKSGSMIQLRRPGPSGECDLKLVFCGLSRLSAVELEVERNISSNSLEISVGWPSRRAHEVHPSSGDLQLSDSHGHDSRRRYRNGGCFYIRLSVCI